DPYFLTFPLIISAALGSGFYFLPTNENNDIEEQFTPIHGPAKSEREFIKKHFPTTDSETFSGQRLYTEGTFASFIAVSKDDNILTTAAFKEILSLDDDVKQLSINNSQGITYSYSLCTRMADSCFGNGILNIINHSLEANRRIRAFFGLAVGGVDLDENYIKKAKAIKLDYYLQDDNDDVKPSAFQFSGLPLNFITLSIIKKLSIGLKSSKYNYLIQEEKEIEKRKLYTNSPSLISLGIGVDDMFVMLASWQKTKVTDKVEDRLADTYAEAAVSVTITTLTYALTFYIGIMTPFQSVQSFCVYTGTTVLFCFIYNITFFGAVLALNGRREASNRHWLTFRKVESDHESEESKCYAMCCVGGAYDSETGTEIEHPIYFFFKEYYGPCLTNIWAKAIVVVLYIGYLSISIYGCLNIKEGIDLRNLAFDGTYVIKFYDDQSAYFSKHGPRVMVAVTEPVEYWDSTAQDETETCMGRLENSSYVDPDLSESWLRVYIDLSKKMSTDIHEKNAFMGNLSTLFQIVPLFKQDTGFSEILVGVAGFMAFWSVNLDSISMINLVICIGFSVDLSAHISYAFVSSDSESANERSVDALYSLGYPIIQGALSTILGVVVLAAAASYIFRTFFKLMFLVITFGAVHGLIFLPMFLAFSASCETSNSAKLDN
ncbi:patched domain-containing protein 3-like, partial [Stegostoma tigrinum]|uniref:patched domain-containing protein 3-like n=1 Tax=Stegostoma tigrinum TaxID=3053191 RepID=UPI00286FC653